MNIVTERVYEWQAGDAGDTGHGRVYAALVDRLWPRGVKKERLSDVEWCKDVAPTNELRKRLHAHTLDFADFAAEYRAELDSSQAPGDLLVRAADARADTLILLFATRDTDHNHAEVLAQYLRDHVGS